MAQEFPTQARVVIIGGGIIGCSVAYHLTKLGWTDVVLLEQGQLSGGTTWHAAGLVGQLRSHANMTGLIRYSTQLYSELEAETGLATGWKNCGSLAVARTSDRMTVLKRTAASARAQGVAVEVISPREAADLWPVMAMDDLVGAVWLPGDGKANPTDLTQSLAKGGAQPRRPHYRARARDGHHGQGRDGAWRRDRPGGYRRRNRRQLRRPVGAQGRADVRRDGPPALGRAHVYRYRQDRGGASGPAGAARPGRLHLFQGGSRRSRHGRLRAGS